MSRLDQVLNYLLVFSFVALGARIFRLYVLDAYLDNRASSLREVEFLPTPTAIVAPQALRPIVGKCVYFISKDGGRKFEFCAYRSIRMILLPSYASNVLGRWNEWKTNIGTDGTTSYISQLYKNGEECVGFGVRECEVIFKVCSQRRELLSGVT